MDNDARLDFDPRAQMGSEKIWSKKPPTIPGYYWMRYIDMRGVPENPDIVLLTDHGYALEFGDENTWELPENSCFEYGPQIHPPE